ncbi:MAG TPA: hypothetical protein VNW15_01195 [Rhizomicrobium sp.]|nr:hypothetical protein [Rhizomicrobium sp.]
MQDKERVLGVHPTKNGFSWIVFESPNVPLDWGTCSARTRGNSRSMAKFERILDRYEPVAVVLETFETREKARPTRAQLLCQGMSNLAHSRGMDTPVYDRELIRMYFARMGASTKHEIAQAVAQRLEPLRRRLPRKRTTTSEPDPRQSLFDAASLVLTHYAVIGTE